MPTAERLLHALEASAVYYAGKLRDPTEGKACISLLKKRRVTQRSAIAFRLGYAPGGPGSAADALTSYLLGHEDHFQPDELEKARAITATIRAAPDFDLSLMSDGLRIPAAPDT